MAVSIGNVAAGVAGRNVTISTAGAGDFLVVFASGDNGLAETASCTYNGIPMNIGQFTPGSPHRAYFFYLANPPSGSNTATVTWTDGTGFYYTYAYTLSGVGLGNPFNLALGAETPSGPISLSVTPTVNGTVILDGISAGAISGAYGPAGGGQTFTDNSSLGNVRSSASGYVVQTTAANVLLSYGGQNPAVEAVYIAIVVQPPQLSGSAFLLKML